MRLRRKRSQGAARRSLVLLSLFATSACVTTPEPTFPQLGTDYIIRVTDNPNAQRFELEFVSKANRAICLTPDHWPNSAGRIDSDEGTTVVVGGQRFPLTDFGTGYCPGCVEARVRSRGTVRASLPYGGFGDLPPDLYGSEKSLEFSPVPNWCWGGG